MVEDGEEVPPLPKVHTLNAMKHIKVVCHPRVPNMVVTLVIRSIALLFFLKFMQLMEFLLILIEIFFFFFEMLR